MRKVIDMTRFEKFQQYCRFESTTAAFLIYRKSEAENDNFPGTEIQPVDMFPHTFHIEAVARLEKI